MVGLTVWKVLPDSELSHSLFTKMPVYFTSGFSWGAGRGVAASLLKINRIVQKKQDTMD